jgi:hypothetical protein
VGQVPLVLEADIPQLPADVRRELVLYRLPAFADARRDQLKPLDVLGQAVLLPLGDQQDRIVSTLLGRPPKCAGKEVASE